MPEQSQLTEKEHAVLYKLAEAWTLFLDLDKQHPMHESEFCTAIHQAQRIVMCRPIERQEGWVKVEALDA